MIIYATRGRCTGNNIRQTYVSRSSGKDFEEMRSTIQFSIPGSENRVFDLEINGELKINSTYSLTIIQDRVADVEEQIDKVTTLSLSHCRQ